GLADLRPRGVGRVLLLLEAALADGAPRAAPVLARQEPAGQRAPRADAHAQLARGRGVLALDGALHQGVLELERNDAVLPLLLGQRLRAGGVPGRHVREAEVADLALADEVGERIQHLLHWRDGVPGVQPVEVHVIRPPAAGRAF